MINKNKLAIDSVLDIKFINLKTGEEIQSFNNIAHSKEEQKKINKELTELVKRFNNIYPNKKRSPQNLLDFALEKINIIE